MEKIILEYGKHKKVLDRFGISYPTLRKYLGLSQGEIKNKKLANMVREYARQLASDSNMFNI